MKESELIFLTRPDTFRGVLPFQRIVQVRHENSLIRTFEGEHTSELAIHMPTVMARQVLKAAMVIGQEEPGSLRSYNCHRFTRTVRGLEDDFAPLREDIDELPEVERLPLGAVGLHYAHSSRPYPYKRYNILHSVVGLGEDSPNALQVFSRESEFGFANIADAISADQADRSYPVRLYQATEAYDANR